MRKGRCPLNPAPPGALAGAWPPGEPNNNLSTNQAATPNANSNPRRCGHSSEAEFEWRRTGAQGALPLEPRPAGGPGRGLASRRAWQGPWHRPSCHTQRKFQPAQTRHQNSPLTTNIEIDGLRSPRLARLAS